MEYYRQALSLVQYGEHIMGLLTHGRIWEGGRNHSENLNDIENTLSNKVTRSSLKLGRELRAGNVVGRDSREC